MDGESGITGRGRHRKRSCIAVISVARRGTGQQTRPSYLQENIATFAFAPSLDCALASYATTALLSMHRHDSTVCKMFSNTQPLRTTEIRQTIHQNRYDVWTPSSCLTRASCCVSHFHKRLAFACSTCVVLSEFQNAFRDGVSVQGSFERYLRKDGKQDRS